MAVGIDLDNLAKESLSNFSTMQFSFLSHLSILYFLGRKSLCTTHTFGPISSRCDTYIIYMEFFCIALPGHHHFISMHIHFILWIRILYYLIYFIVRSFPALTIKSFFSQLCVPLTYHHSVAYVYFLSICLILCIQISNFLIAIC